MRRIKSLLSAFVMSFASVILLAAPASAAGTVVITGNTSSGENVAGWMFNRDPNNTTPFEFTTDEYSRGSGSLYVKPIGANGPDKFTADYYYLGSADDFESFSYDFQIGSDGNTSYAGQFYLNVYANLPGTPVDNFYNCRFDYVPTTGAVGSFTQFDVDKNTAATRVAGNNCPDKSEGLNGLEDGSTIRLFTINVGDTSVNDEGVNGYLDNVAVNLTGDSTVYDFEAPVGIPVNKNECKKNGWKSFVNPVSFKNQGQCVSFVESARNHAASNFYELDSSNIDGVDIPLQEGTWYKVSVSGTWTNRSGEVVDAECTSMNGNDWMNAVDGGYSSDLLDVQINDKFVNWGECDSDTHTYTKWVKGTAEDLNLRVFDGNTDTNEQISSWFGDNNGVLEVAITSYSL